MCGDGSEDEASVREFQRRDGWFRKIRAEMVNRGESARKSYIKAEGLTPSPLDSNPLDVAHLAFADYFADMALAHDFSLQAHVQCIVGNWYPDIIVTDDTVECPLLSDVRCHVQVRLESSPEALQLELARFVLMLQELYGFQDISKIPPAFIITGNILREIHFTQELSLKFISYTLYEGEKFSFESTKMTPGGKRLFKMMQDLQNSQKGDYIDVKGEQCRVVSFITKRDQEVSVMNVRRLKDEKVFAVKAPYCLLYRDDSSEKPVYDDVPLAIERSLAFERVLHRDLDKTSTICLPINAKGSTNFTIVYPEELRSFIDAIHHRDPRDNRSKEEYRDRATTKSENDSKKTSSSLLALCHSILSRVLDLHSAGYIHGNLNPNTIFVGAKNSSILFDWTHVRRSTCKMPYTLPHSITSSVPLLLSQHSTPTPTDDLEALLLTFYLGRGGSSCWHFAPCFCRHAFIDNRLGMIQDSAKTGGEKSFAARILKGLKLLESSQYSPRKLLSLFSNKSGL